MTDRFPRPAAAVLVHGLWGWPDDWRWVRQLLEQRGLTVATPDLPSHSSPDAGFREDVATVREALLASPQPTIAVGWSYGCDVIGVAAADLSGVTRLVYVSAVPQRIHPETRDDSNLDGNPILRWQEDGRFYLHDEWRQETRYPEFSAEVRQHFAAYRRRPVTRRTQSDPIDAEAWRTVPTVVLTGTQDDLANDESRAWARRAVGDVREIDCDHFIPFSRPEVVVDAILETSDAAETM